MSSQASGSPGRTRKMFFFPLCVRVRGIFFFLYEDLQNVSVNTSKASHLKKKKKAKDDSQLQDFCFLSCQKSFFLRAGVHCVQVFFVKKKEEEVIKYTSRIIFTRCYTCLNNVWQLQGEFEIFTRHQKRMNVFKRRSVSSF